MQALQGAVENAMVSAIGNASALGNPMTAASLEYFKALTSQTLSGLQDAKPVRLERWRQLLADEQAKPAGEQCQAYIDKILVEIENV
jgi:hypothetical protein